MCPVYFDLCSVAVLVYNIIYVVDFRSGVDCKNNIHINTFHCRRNKRKNPANLSKVTITFRPKFCFSKAYNEKVERPVLQD